MGLFDNVSWAKPFGDSAAGKVLQSPVNTTPNWLGFSMTPGDVAANQVTGAVNNQVNQQNQQQQDQANQDAQNQANQAANKAQQAATTEQNKEQQAQDDMYQNSNTQLALQNARKQKTGTSMYGGLI